MPVYDYVCKSESCGKVTEQIVPTSRVETITCSCGAEATKADMGFMFGTKRHVGVYFNYLGDQ